MEERTIKITIDNYSNILIFVNDQLKITIDEKTNQITGKQIYDAIQLNALDKVSIDELDSKLIEHKRYKICFMIYQLFKSIVDEINSCQDNIVYDVDVTEFPDLEKNEIEQ